MNSSNFIFLFGMSVRSGTNFSGKIFSKHPDVEVIPQNQTTREFPLLNVIDKFKTGFETFAKMYTDNNGNKDHYTWSNYGSYFGNSILKYIEDHLIEDKSKKKYFIKDPYVINLTHFRTVFPKSKLILLVRDGRDIVESSEKAYLIKKTSQSKLNRLKRYIFHYTGREFRRNVKAWKQNAKIIHDYLQTAEGESALLIRYEDLHSEIESVYRELFAHCDLSFDNVLYKDVEVMGSSFSDQISDKGKNKVDWNPIKKTDAFKPVGRWHDWPKWKVRYFNKVAGDYLAIFGYQ